MKPDVHSPSKIGRGAELAAQAIVELINSRPVSPRQDEIMAIIERLGEETSPAPCPHCDALNREYGPATKYSP